MIKLRNKLLAYSSKYTEEMNAKIRILAFLDSYEKPFSRQLLEGHSMIGHFTASAFLLNSDRSKFLLMYHKKLNKWLQLGGHCDGDSDLLAVAVKEAKEESGISEIEPINTEIYDIDVHHIPALQDEPAHYHYDVRFLLKTINNDNFIKNSESRELKWLALDDYNSGNFKLEQSITRMIEKICCR